MRTFVRACLALVIVVLLGVVVAMAAIGRRGLSARVEPTRIETALARSLRALSTPRAVRARPNPVQATPAVVDEALAHFADHCATCHANDGSGQTDLGRGLYPRVPDMRLPATQALTDGELFWVIEHGLRHTGMPAWGDGSSEGERQSWGLVHFVRRLPTLTDEQLERMAGLNPKTPAEFRREEDARRFLAGEDEPSVSTPTHQH
jgi:mono/diheme cytochrome c family protein